MKFTLLLHTFFTITVCFNHFIHTQGTHIDLIYHKSTNSPFLCILSKNDYKMYRLFDLHCYTIPIIAFLVFESSVSNENALLTQFFLHFYLCLQ